MLLQVFMGTVHKLYLVDHSFLWIVWKTVRYAIVVLSDHCLSCPVCLLCWCIVDKCLARDVKLHLTNWQMLGWIKMKLGLEVGLGPGHIVLDGDPTPQKEWGTAPPHPVFGPCLLWPNGWMDQGGTWYGDRPRPRPYSVRWRLSSPSKKGHSPPIFGPCLLWPNGWMDQDVTWYGGRPRPRRHCVRWEPSSPMERGAAAPTFRPMSIVAKRSPISATAELLLS